MKRNKYTSDILFTFILMLLTALLLAITVFGVTSPILAGIDMLITRTKLVTIPTINLPFVLATITQLISG